MLFAAHMGWGAELMNSVNLEQARANFADDIRRTGDIKSAALIEGLATVPREDFLGPGPWRILRPADMAKGYQSTPDADPRHLYDNVLVALDESRMLNNGEPLALLLFLDSLQLSSADRFLHVGCGVGYYTAIAAHAVGSQGSVVGVEIDQDLAARADKNLRPYRNVKVIIADGALGNFGSFDAIFVNAGCTRPQPSWLDQLAIGGRLLIPLTVELPSAPGIGAGYMLLVTRHETGYAARLTSPVGIFHCESARTSEGSALLAKALAQGDFQSIRALRRERHEQGPNCWLHADGFCLEADPALRRAHRAPVAIDSALFNKYVGRYQLAPDLFMTVTRQGDALFAQVTGQASIAIYPESEHTFFYTAVDAQITFVAEGLGAASGLILHQGGRDTLAKRVE
jgi:protein-L-isoaspartate(D-aspartate) O-methyltransferase